MRRLWHRAYNRGNGQARRKFAGKGWRTVATGPNVDGAGDVLLTFQTRLAGIGSGARIRFVRVRPDGQRDGTGDHDLIAGQRFLTHQHVVDRRDFTVEAQIHNGGRPFRVDYCYLKATV